MFCIEIISICVFSFILDHFPNISKNPEGSLKQLVNNKNISYQLLGIKRGCQQFSRIRRQKQKFNFFFICSKRPYRCIKTLFFSKLIFQKFQRVFILEKKHESSKSAKRNLVCIISIWLSEHFHNARTRQQKIILDSFFHKLFFIPWSSFETIFHLQLNFLSFVTTRVKYTIFSIPFVR